MQQKRDIQQKTSLFRFVDFEFELILPNNSFLTNLWRNILNEHPVIIHSAES